MKYGFESFVRKFESFVPLSKKVSESVSEGRKLSKPERIRYVLQDLGPLAIKFGQWMSTRPDVLPLEYLNEFEKLQDHVPPFSFEEVKDTIKNELGEDVENLFDHFSSRVIASGSIAQVHKAKLKDGTNVAVKVQRPGIKETIDTDMEILTDLARFAGEHIIKTEVYDPVAIVDEFSFALEKQLDFWNEAKNIDRFGKNFEEVDYVLVPNVFSELTSGRVITLKYIDGVKVNDIKGIEKLGLDKKTIASNIANSYLKQIYVDGFFHGDPHPGNLFVLPRNIIGFTDFGIMGFLDKHAKEYLSRVLMAVVRNDSREMAEAMMGMGNVMGETDFESFVLDIDYMLQRYFGIPLKEVRIGEVLGDITKVMNKHNIKILPNLGLLTVTMWSVEGLVQSIDPEFDTLEASKPFVSDLISQRMNPVSRLREFGRNVNEYYDFFDGFPGRVDRILTKIEKGELTIIFRDERLERLNVVIDKASNRLVVGAVISAVILGSSLVIVSGRDPAVKGIRVLDMLLLVTAFLGFWLVFSVLRSKKY
jgi:ubiquinone biosynthesis protein